MIINDTYSSALLEPERKARRSKAKNAVLAGLTIATVCSSVIFPASAQQVLKEQLPTIPRGDNLEVRLAYVTIQPGAVDNWHSYPHHPIVHVVEGTLKVELRDGGEKVYNAGDGFIEPINTVLRGSNNGNTPVKLVVFRLSPPDAPDAIAVPAQ